MSLQAQAVPDQIPPGPTPLDLDGLVFDLGGDPTRAGTRLRIAELGAALVVCAGVDLVEITASGQLRILASSNPGLSQASAAIWLQWPHFPVVGFESPRIDLGTQNSSYRRQMIASARIWTELLVPLCIGDRGHGHLRFLFDQRSEYRSPARAELQLIRTFAQHAAFALDRMTLVEQVASLQAALDSNRRIGAAIGVLMVREQLTYPQGLSRLMTASQNGNRKVREVAEGVLRTGEVASTRRPAA